MPDEGPPKDEGENIIRMASRAKRKGFSATLFQLARILRTEPELGAGTMFKLDLFSGETLLMMRIPRPGVEPPQAVFKPHFVTDIDITHLIEWLEVNGCKGKINRSTVDQAVQAEGHRNSFSSGLFALDRLPAWDGVYRLDKFWQTICGAVGHEEGMDEEETWQRQRYLTATARCFFISIVARIKKPVLTGKAAKVDTMVILEGPQGSLKSTLLRVLAFDRDEWFSDSMIADLRHKDARSHLAGKLIIEMAEMTQMHGTRAETMKAFLSAQDDKFRPSFGRRDILQLRQCVFVGTTNTDDYLVDITGNRRFWPIKCGRIDIGKARELRDQLYAEAIVAFGDGSGDGSRGEQWWLADEVEPIASDEQRSRLTSDPWEPEVRDLVATKLDNERSMYAWVTTKDVLRRMDIEPGKQDRAGEMRAAALLSKLGGKRAKLPRGEGWPQMGWRFDTVGNSRYG